MKTRTELVTLHEPSSYNIDRIMACVGSGKLSNMTPLEKMYFMQGAILYKHRSTALDAYKQAMEEAHHKLSKMIYNKLYGPGDVTKDDMLFLNNLYTDVFDGDIDEAYHCFTKTYR